MYYNGRWGTVCNDGWDEQDAKILCRQLGFKSSEIADFGLARKEEILLDNVTCFSNDTILASCGHYGVGIRVGCNHNSYYKVAGVKCYGEWFILHFRCIMNHQNGFSAFVVVNR